VQSNEIATNRTKVTAFVDGMPILGSQGAIGFGNLEQVEVYRGPQSAAFGRSTFGGAINYVTRDPGDAYEGNVSADVNGYGRRLLRGGASGPISDSVGFLVHFEYEDSTAPDEYLASDGAQAYFSAGNDEYPAVEGARVAASIATLGTFKGDDVSLAEVAGNVPVAQRIYNEVGWE